MSTRRPLRPSEMSWPALIGALTVIFLAACACVYAIEWSAAGFPLYQAQP
jgi:hypothetical protein